MLRSLHNSHQLWRFWLPVGLLASAVALFGDVGRQLLSFDRSAIRSGEIWRLATGHASHLGSSHLMLNLLGLALIAVLVAPRFSVRCWWLTCAICVFGTSLGLWLVSTDLQNYVGLSGVLHGLLVAGVLQGVRSEYRNESLILLAAILVKLAYEQIAGPIPGSEVSTGGAVIVDAHMYGALSGLIAWLVLHD